MSILCNNTLSCTWLIVFFFFNELKKKTTKKHCSVFVEMIEDKWTNAQQQLIMVTKNSMANEMVFAILNHLHTIRSIDKLEKRFFFFIHSDCGFQSQIFYCTWFLVSERLVVFFFWGNRINWNEWFGKIWKENGDKFNWWKRRIQVQQTEWHHLKVQFEGGNKARSYCSSNNINWWFGTKHKIEVSNGKGKCSKTIFFALLG